MWGAEGAFRATLVGGRDGAMAEAVVAARGEVVAELAWGEPLVCDAETLLILDSTGEDLDRLPGELRDWAERADVVCCDFEQLDVVAGALLFADAQPLCQPDMTDRVAALLIAARGEDAPAFVGETDDQRLGRLGDDLARVVDLLSHLVHREETRSGALGERTLGYSPPPTDATSVRVDPAEIRRVIRARRAREKAFGMGSSGARLFEDPAWDILLDLYAASLEHIEVSVSSLCIAAAVAPTTAVRWIGRMTAAGLLVRTQDATDKRRALVTLSDAALAGMRRYAALLRQGGLPFV